MLDFLAGCMIFLMFMAVWAAIGHGIWILVAKIGSSLFGGATEQQRTPETLTNEIEAALRQLERLWRRGLISDEEHERLRAACQRDLDRLNGSVAIVPAAPPIASPITHIAPPIAADIAIVEAEVVTDDLRPFIAPPLAPPVTPTPAVHPLDRADEVIPPAPVAPPQARRALADVLAAFMQSRNIRWGELVSGLLIVGSAAGLVLSLRDQLQAWIPYFPAFLFLLGTAAMHGAGLYTLRKWNLQSTSRGVLLITMLLVPLNFLAAILISGDDAQRIPVASWSYLLAVTVGLLAYGTITYTGAHALVGRTWPALALAVFGTSIPQLAINRLIHADSSSTKLLLLGGSTVVTFMLGIVWCVVAGRHWKRLSLRRAQPLLMTLGLGGFAFVLPLVLLLGKSERVWFSLAQLTPIFALLGATIIAAGVFITQRTQARHLGALATTGTTLAILGGLMMLLAIGFSWPEPPRLITVGLLCAITLTGQSFLGRTAALQIPAAACVSLAALVGFHTWQGSYSGDEQELHVRLLQSVLMGRSALLLTAIAATVMAYAGTLWKYRLRDHATYLIVSATGLMVLSLIVAAYSGFWSGEDAALATWVFAIYAIALTIATFVRQHRAITVAASLLWLVVSIHAYGFNEPLRAWLTAHEWLPERPVLLATIVHAVNAALAALALAWFDRSSKWRREVIEPLAGVAFGVSLTTLLFVIPTPDSQYALHAGYLSAIAATWLSAALLLRSPQLTTAAQALSTLAAAFVAVAMSQQFGQTTSWVVSRWMMVLLAVVIWGALWSLARRVSELWPSLHSLLAPPWPKCDQVVLLSAVVIALLTTFAAVAVGISHELGAKSPAQIAGELVWLETLGTPLAWTTLAAIALALSGAFWERRELPWIVSLLLVALTGVGLFALGFAEEIAIASAFRWGLAGYLLVAIPILCARRRLANALDKLPLAWRGAWPDYTSEASIATTLLGAALPIVLVTLFACAQAGCGITARGPVVETFFAELDPTISYTVPLMAVVASLLALGLRQHQPGYVMAGSVAWQLLITLGCVLPVLLKGDAFDHEFLVELWQWNGLGLAIYALVWLTLEPWLVRRGEASAACFDPLVAVQVALLLAANFGLAIWASGWIIAEGPFRQGYAPLPFGSPLGFAVFSVTTIVLVWYGLTYARRELVPLCWWLVIAAVPSIAAAMLPYNQVWAWTSYHLLVGGWLAIGASAGAVACLQHRVYAALGTCLTMLSLVIGLTVVTGWRDPISWCPVALLGGALLVICALGLYRRHNAYAYASVPLSLLMSTQAFVQFVPSRQWDAVDFIAINLLASIAICAWWLAVEIYRERTAAIPLPRWQTPVPLTITPIVVVVYTLFITLSLLVSNSFWHNAMWAVRTPSLVVTVALGSYLFAMLWFDRQRLALPCLYVWGLMVSLTLSEAVPKHWRLGDVALPALAAAYILLTAVLWQFGGLLANYGQTLRIHEPVAGLKQTSRWLPIVTLGLASILLLCNFGLVLVESTRTARLIAGFGPVLLALAVAMLAQQRRRELMIYLSLCFATVAAILLAWADLPPHIDALTWLRRLIRVLVVLGSLAFLYAIVLPRAWSHLIDWVTAVRRMSLTSAIGAGVSICIILVLEAQQFFTGQASQLSHAEVGIVAAVLLLLVAALISMAVSKREAWGDEQSRMAYVYAAQLVLALAFGHMYLTRPYWFDGLLRPYWPYIVMAIAFGGVGLSEWFARLKLRVLSEPFLRSGMFLPLLPAIGWWVEASQRTPSTDYALVMFVVGLLYVAVSLIRQSLVSAMFAGVAGNVALWSLMHERDVRLIEHPQFWLIPPAISVLAAAQWNQHRLSHAQLTATRYLCMIVVYLSSTSEVFLRVESFWPPLILAALAVVGVLVGIALQIRAFLYLGTSFVFLAMVTMVWHASRAFGQVWPWWVFGICVGLAMLVLFGLFEKKRAEITLLIDRLRQWEK